MSTKTTKQPASETASPPVARIRIGLITASIWERVTDKGHRFHTVSFERRYKGKDGKWATAHNYDAADLLALAKCADMSHSRILDLQNQDADEGAGA